MALKPQDDTPEFDAIDGLPLPRQQMRLFGHTEAERELLDSYRSPRMHHAWILGGPKGIGKATLAFRFARFVLANPNRMASQLSLANDLTVDAEHPAARRLAAGAHGDVLHLHRPWDHKAKRFKTQLTIDEVRRTVSFFGSTSTAGGWRVCIVDAADDMNVNAANALLKVLEEPPKQCVFFVLSHAPGRLLPTIRSRCRTLQLKALPAETVFSGLEALGLDAAYSAEDRTHATELSDGSLRRAIELLSGGGIEVAHALQALLAQLPKTDVRTVHRFADMVSARGADDSYHIFLDLLREWLDGRVRAGAAEQVPAARLVRWVEVWDKTNEAASLADALNLDRKQVVLGAFGALAKAAGDAAPK
ncbi:DNA polymerase III subunit delta' [Breoghania sp. L-A4]|uniref:DNA polymerase III subunit delta' n=1 Tax=Breoghania sp. L-A4 TaxID=2304600 RepID=UPI000E35B454|nr:DNA polymerase III subunit delta' [Breoghania sp. L-A4]AXS40671.1 DNA polymerase III subunit delta' [Breoghania sp. L-A4]